LDASRRRRRRRIAAHKFAVNGVSLAPIEKTIENGRKIVAFRTEKTVAALRKAMAAARQPQP
jgi:creatinine amidohydrolase/Fe(II)-dependent formamide hydrolase-like protein